MRTFDLKAETSGTVGNPISTSPYTILCRRRITPISMITDIGHKPNMKKTNRFETVHIDAISNKTNGGDG